MIRSDFVPASSGEFDLFRKHARQVYERAALRSVARAATRGKSEIRRAFAGASLGRLGNAIDSSSDDRVHDQGRGAFSASAQFFPRTRSERSLGALEAYTQGAEIVPVRSRWLWIATNDIPQFVGSGRGRARMTPALYRERGFDRKIGPLTQIRSINGYPLLIARNVGVSAVGKARSAKSLTKGGRPRKGQRAKETLVAFIGIPRTARAARVNITSILDGIRRDELPAIFASELAKERKR